MAGQSVVVSVLADTKQFSSQFKALSNDPGIGKLKSGLASLGKVAVVGLTAAGAAVGALAVTGVKAAADLQQSIGGVDAVFKDNAKTVHAWAKSAAKDVGLSQNSYNELGTVIGSQLKNAGVPMDKLAGKTNDVIKIGADLSAMFGGTTTDAVGALSSALKGEMDPIEKYGISLNQASIQAEAVRLGLVKGKGALSQSAKAQAILSLVTKQGADAQGAFGRESDTLAHQQQVLGAQFDNIKATIGMKLLPILTKLATWFNDKGLPAIKQFGTWLNDNVVPVIEDFANQAADKLVPALKDAAKWITGSLLPALKDFGGFLKDNATVLESFAVGIGAIVIAWKAYKTVMTIVKTATKAYAAVQAALNAVMAMNPIGLIVLALVGLAAGLVFAYKKSQTFRDIVDGAFQAVADAGKWLWENALKPAFDGIKGAFKAVGDAANFLWDNVLRPVFKFCADAWLTVVGVIVHGAAEAFGWVPGVGPKLKSAAAEFDKLRARVDGSLDGIGDVAEGYGTDWANGLARGIRANQHVPVGVAQGIANKIAAITRQAMDSHSPSRVAAAIGKDWNRGIAVGLKQLQFVRKAAVGVVDAVAKGFTSAPTLNVPPMSFTPLVAGAGAAMGVQNTYSITVQAPVGSSSADIGKALVKHIDEYQRLGGRRRR